MSWWSPSTFRHQSIKELRKLIAVPPKTERAPRAFAQAHVEDSGWIEAALKFRQAVAQEFERLVREGIPATEPAEIEN